MKNDLHKSKIQMKSESQLDEHTVYAQIIAAPLISFSGLWVRRLFLSGETYYM
jgi:hypothetical protein